MKAFSAKYPRFIALCVTFCALSVSQLAAQDAGSRASFTRSGWVGSRYIAMGKAAEAIADDVYAIYWNPAGLVDLGEQQTLSPDDIREKVQKGDVKGISEQDLIRFSDEGDTRSFVQAGVSAALLDVEREAGFAGIAFGLGKGVMGCGLYLIQSRGIEGRDDSGNYTGDLDYVASTGFLSYGFNTGLASMGLSLKGMQERIGESTYYGAAADFGANVDVLPFLRLSFVIQDIGQTMQGDESEEEMKRRYDFGYPSLKVSAALTNRNRDFTLAVSGVKKIEQEKYELNGGIQYNVSGALSLHMGLNEANFAAGLSIHLLGMNIGYAFSVDNIDYGYNNIVSLSLVL